MDKVKKILYRYLSPEYIALAALEARQDDTPWMIKKGYKTDFKLNSRGLMVGGEITKEGEEFLRECDKKFDNLFPKCKNVSPEDEYKARKELLALMKAHTRSELCEGLSDEEQRTFDKITSPS